MTDKVNNEVSVYEVKYFECVCPFCTAVVRVSNDAGYSGASFYQKCTECNKTFPARCG